MKVPVGSLFSLASEVEMDFDEDNSGTTWLPAVSLGQVGADHFILKHKSSGKHGMEHGEKLVHVKRIRPRPPPIEKKSFELLEKIEALRGSCWSVGLITRCLEGERYTVTFRHEKKEMDFNLTDLRPHLDWIEGKWVTNLKVFFFCFVFTKASIVLQSEFKKKIGTVFGLQSIRGLNFFFFFFLL